MQRLDIKLNYDGDVVRPMKHCVWSETRSVETQAFGKVPARTHPTRIYDKAGVNSQSALVRLMMSIETVTR